MLQDFVLIQRKAIEDDFVTAPGADTKSWFQFKTCMRNMLLGPKDELQLWSLSPNEEIIEGETSYQYFLEVISGLHSSLVGETEILGQFKNATLKFDFPNSHFGFELKKFFQALLEDVKKVRTKHLSDLGSQSYGSLLRKEIKRLSETEVHILGAGHLCEEILPWIAKEGTELHIHVRNLLTAQNKFKSPRYIWHDVKTSQKLSGILVIAAPLETSELQALVKSSPELKYVYDLRHNSDQEKLFLFCPLKTLSQFMNILGENIGAIEERKALAMTMIHGLAKLRTQTVEHRPFGWEDMTA